MSAATGIGLLILGVLTGWTVVGTIGAIFGYFRQQREAAVYEEAAARRDLDEAFDLVRSDQPIYDELLLEHATQWLRQDIAEFEAGELP